MSGIDDRSILAVLVSAIKGLASKVSETAHLIIDTLTAHRVETTELCVDDICVTRDQFAEVFGSQSAAAGTPYVALPQEAPATLPEAATSATSGPAIIGTNGDNAATASSTLPLEAANDNEPLSSSQTPTSTEDAGHENDEAQNEENDPNPEPEIAPTLHIPAPLLEPTNENSPAQVSSTAVNQ